MATKGEALKWKGANFQLEVKVAHLNKKLKGEQAKVKQLEAIGSGNGVSLEQIKVRKIFI
jgi:hypothetical protein